MVNSIGFFPNGTAVVAIEYIKYINERVATMDFYEPYKYVKRVVSDVFLRNIIAENKELFDNLYRLYNINDKLKSGITKYFRSGLIHHLVPAKYKDWYMAVILGGTE